MTTVGCSISKITRFVAFPGVSNLGRQPVDPLYVQSLTPSNNRVHAVAIRRPPDQPIKDEQSIRGPKSH